MRGFDRPTYCLAGELTTDLHAVIGHGAGKIAERLNGSPQSFLKEQYSKSMHVLNQRLVDIYESDQPTSLDVFLGAGNVQEAIDQVQYLNDIGEQDRRIAQQVAEAKAAIKVQRAKTKKLRANVHAETAVLSARTAFTRVAIFVSPRAAERS